VEGGRRTPAGPAVNGDVVATPGKARPYAVIVRRRRIVVRQEPVESLAEGRRLLVRLLADAAIE
jgi:hypothetical protein